MKTILLIAAALLLPLVWGYLVALLMQRLWPHPPPADEARSHDKDDSQTPYLDYQI